MWTDTVPLISDGQSGDQATFNAPLQALADRTTYLKQQLDGITNKSNIVQYGAIVKSDVVVGDLVYYNSTTLWFEKALAAWSDEYDSNGDLKPSPKSLVRGLVIEKTGAETASLLLAGEYESASIVAALFAAPGEYYLSATDPGKVSAVAPALKVPVLSYQGGNLFVFNQGAAYSPNHTHKSLEMVAGWLDITDPSFDGMEIPGTAVKGYDISSDPGLQELFSIYHGEAVVFNDGILLDTASVVVNDDNVWWMRADVPQGVFRLYAYMPFVRGEPLLRTASSDTTSELVVAADNGHLKVNAVPWTVSPAASPVPVAVSSITGKVLVTTPVVTSVTAGAGAQVTLTSQGKAVVSLDTSMEALVDGDLVDLNNALQYSDDPFIFFNFPAGRESSILYRVRIPKLGTNSSYIASAWAVRKGMTGGTVPSPVKYPSIAVVMTFVPHPGALYTDLGTLAAVSTSLQEFDSVQGRLYFHETPSGLGRIAVASEGTLYIKLSAASSSGEKVVSRFGAKIYAV